MATISFDIPDALLPDLIEAFAEQNGGYKETILDPNADTPVEIPNPLSKAQFAKEQIRAHIKQIYVRYKNKQAQQASTFEQDADTFTAL